MQNGNSTSTISACDFFALISIGYPVAPPIFRTDLFPKSIELFIEGQAFSQSYDLAPPSPSLPPYPVSRLNRRRHTGRLRKRDNLLTGEGREGGGRGAESYHRKKAWYSINHSILSCLFPYFDSAL